MEVKVERKDKHLAEITFVGEDIAMVQAMREYLAENDDVEFAGVLKEHPESASPKLVLRVKKGDPVAMAAKAAGKVAKEATDLKKKLK
ncbi:MAG: RpoL/Rpb11 RNA polymerase subunit family protein [Candidatus Micrarchaeia archaeon]